MTLRSFPCPPHDSAIEKPGGARALVELLAAGITLAIAKGRRVCHAPVKWRLIMLVIRHLPWFVFRKMDI